MEQTKILTEEGLVALKDNVIRKVNERVSINQGIEHFGNVLVINEEGNVLPGNASSTTDSVYHDAEATLELVEKTVLKDTVMVDSTLSLEGEAAEAKTVGEKIKEVIGMIVDPVQADWAETNTSSLSYIENKPAIPSKLSDLELDIEVGAVKTVNGVEPDANGNVEIKSVVEWNELEGKPTKLSEFENDMNFVVTITGNSNENYTSDKTFAEIQAAYESGMNITAISSLGAPCSLAGINNSMSSFLYTAFDNGQLLSYFITILNDNTVTEEFYDIYIGYSSNLETEATSIVEAINELNAKHTEGAEALILVSPNGTKFNITVGDDGVLKSDEITE